MSQIGTILTATLALYALLTGLFLLGKSTAASDVGVDAGLQARLSDVSRVRGSKPPGRPEEFHLQPPTEPCVNLSIYTARPSHCPAILR